MTKAERGNGFMLGIAKNQLDLRGGQASLSSSILAGDVAQLEERHNGIVEVVGSNPIGSTILKLKGRRVN